MSRCLLYPVAPPHFTASSHLPTSTAFSLTAHRRSTSARERQIIADINQGSEKAQRKLLSHKRGKSNSTIVPVTVLPDDEGTSSPRKGRASTSSNRPKLPKRSSSMVRIRSAASLPRTDRASVEPTTIFSAASQHLSQAPRPVSLFPFLPQRPGT
jgi:hypothetical protein